MTKKTTQEKNLQVGSQVVVKWNDTIPTVAIVAKIDKHDITVMVPQGNDHYMRDVSRNQVQIIN